MKKLICLFLAILMLITSAPFASAVAEQGNATFTVDTVEGDKDDVVLVNINLEETKTLIGALTIILDFDPTQLQLTAHPNSRKGDWMIAGDVLTDSSASAVLGDDRFAAITTDGFWLNGAICQVAFKVLKDIPVGKTFPISLIVDTVTHCENDDYSYNVAVIDGGVSSTKQPLPNKSATFTVATVQGDKDDVVLVNLFLEEEQTEIGALTMILDFDPSVLQPTPHPESRKGDWLIAGDVLTDSAASVVVGDDRFAAITVAGFWVSGTVCEMAFKVLKDIPQGQISPVSVIVDTITHCETDDYNYDVTVIDGGVVPSEKPPVPSGHSATFTVDTVEGEKDDVVLVDINLAEQETLIGALTMILDFDPTQLQLTAHPDSRKGDWMVVGEVVTDSGATVAIGDDRFAAATIDGFWLNGTICTVAFKVLKDIPEGEIAPVSVKVTTIDHCEDSNYTYDVTVVDGGVIPAEKKPVIPDKYATFTIETVEGEINDVVLLNVDIVEAQSEIGALELTILYDPNQLQLTAHPDSRKDDWMVTGEVMKECNATVVCGNNKIAAAAVDGTWLNGTMFSVAFKVLQELPEGEIAPVSLQVNGINHYSNSNYVYGITVNDGGVISIDTSAAKAVSALIAALDVQSLGDEADVIAAREAYNELPEKLKKYVTNLPALEAAETTIENMIAAARVSSLIDALNVQSINDKPAVTTARSAYDALTDVQKGYVTNLTKLEAAEATIKDMEAAARVEDLIDALNVQSLDNKAVVMVVRNTYNALTETQKGYVTNLAKLEAAEAIIKDMEAAAKVDAQIDSLNVQSLDDEPAVIAARNAYEALTDAQKGYVVNLPKLEEAEAAIEKLKVRYGDVNNDGTVGALDALLVLQAIVGKIHLTDREFLAADVSGSGNIEALDALYILQIIVGKIDRFPVEQ